MAQITTLREAVGDFIANGSSVAMEGFTHLIPHAAGHEVIRQHVRDLTLYRMTPDIIYDQLIGVGAARKLVFSWGGNPGVGSLHRLRDAVERGWPARLELEEHSHASMTAAYVAGAAGLPFGVLRTSPDTDIAAHNANIKFVTCPFTGENLTAVAAHRPDVAVIHAQRADRDGNVQFWGIIGIQKEAALASRHVIVTVERLVDQLDPVPGAVVIPATVVTAVCEAPGGAHPSYAQGFDDRDNAFYLAWDDVSRDRERFVGWIDRHVRGTSSMNEFRQSIARTEGMSE